MARWYGNVINRIEENRPSIPEIEVGTGVTEYCWSDRHAYEVIEVKDQKHVTIREYDHKCIGGPYSNEWELISNPDNRTINLVKRGKYWYVPSTWTDKDGKDHKHYSKMNVRFGVASYYYDYEF